MSNLPKFKETMQRDFLKFGKVFTNIAFTPLLLISNNSELSAKYLPNNVKQSLISSEINHFLLRIELNEIVNSSINFTISFNKTT